MVQHLCRPILLVLLVNRLADVTVYRSGCTEMVHSDWYVYRSRMTLCTEVVIDMYRSSFVAMYRSGTPDVPKWSCTDLALPPWGPFPGSIKLVL